MWPFKKSAGKAQPAPPPVNVAARSVFERTTDPVRSWYAGDGLLTTEITLADVRRCAAYSAAADVLAESFASLPWHCYRRTGDTGREPETLHPHAALLKEPAPGWTPFAWLEKLVRDLAYFGNFYAERVIEAGFIAALVPLDADKMTVVSIGNRTGYKYAGRVLTAAEVLHIQWRSHDGTLGVAPWMDGQDEVQLALRIARYSIAYFRNSTTLGGVIECPPELQLSPDGKRLLLQQFLEVHQSQERAFKPALLDGGMSFKPVGSSAEDSQLTDARRLSVEGVARLLRVPPSLIGSFDRATWSNASESLRMFGMQTLAPLAVRVSQALTRMLFPDDDSIFVEIAVDGMLRGSPLERAEVLTKLKIAGIATANECRKYENWPPHPQGDALEGPEPADESQTINVSQPAITVEPGSTQITLSIPPRAQVERLVAERDGDGFPVRVVEREIPEEVEPPCE